MAEPGFDVWHVAIPVADLERSLAFYLDLGFALAGRDEYSSTRQAFVRTRPGGFTIELFQPEKRPSKARRPDHLAFECEDVVAYRKRLEARGLRPPRIETYDNGVRTFSIADPEGVRLDFFQGRAIYERSLRPPV